MQPTTINKIVSLFIAGGLVILGLGYALSVHGYTLTPSDEAEKLLAAGGEGFFAIVGGLLLLPLVALAGAVSEGLTNILIRRMVKWMADGKVWIRILFQAKAQETYRFWLTQFTAAAANSKLLDGFPTDKNPHGTAVGVMYDSGEEHAINWAESHYSTYIMVTNFVLLAFVAQLYLVFDKLLWPYFGVGTLIAIGVFYTCLSLSVHRYLYSYQVALRQSALTLLKQKKEIPDSKPCTSAGAANNPGAEADG